MATRSYGGIRELMVAATLVLALSVGSVDAGVTCYSSKDCQNKPNALANCNLRGACEYSCKAGWSNCDSNWINGCERNTNTDINYCGSCGLQCIIYSPETVITSCVNGKCVSTCKAGLSDCNNWLRDGCESRLPYNYDLRFCGACDTPCLMSLPNADSKCNRGKCEYACHPGWQNCDQKWTTGCETDVSKDTRNCGKCGLKCKVTLKNGEAICLGNNCGEQCKKGFNLDNRTKICVRSN